MIQIKSLKFKAFRSFIDETTVEFPPSGLVLIRGQNKGTGDSSGSGKSSILLAISYALDICPFSASELQNWQTEEPLQVELSLTSPRGDVVIKRGKKNSFKLGKEEVTGAKAISEAIRNLFGLDSETLSAITYRPQNTPGLFLGLTDSGKKEFLTKVLGLDKIESAVELAEANIKRLAPSLELADREIANKEAEIVTLKSQVFPEPQKTEDLQLQLARDKDLLSTIEAEIKATERVSKEKEVGVDKDPQVIELRTYLEAAKTQLQELNTVNNQRNQEFRQKQEALRKRLAEIVRQDTLKISLVRDIQTQKEALVHTLKGQCGTCHRIWDQAAQKSNELKSVIANLEAQLQALGDFTAAKQTVERELRENFSNDPDIETMRTVIQNIESQLQNRTRELTQDPIARAQEVLGPLNVKRATVIGSVKSLEQQIKTIQDMNSKLDVGRKFSESNLAAATSKLQTLLSATAETRKELNSEKDFLALLGRDGFLGVIFEDVLKEIETEANLRLGRLANVGHVVIQFKSESVTQKGTVNKTITPIVSVGGVETKLKSGLSGGQFTSVELTVDLALISVIQRRTGSMPGFLFLDECFNGQGIATKEAAMEVLQEYGQDKMVLVIDHSSEFKEQFQHTVDISCNDGRSSVIKQ